VGSVLDHGRVGTTARCRVVVPTARPKRRSRSELPTTLTLEAAIAAPAITGSSNPAAASGIAAAL
jgi:hypothetical protein